MVSEIKTVSFSSVPHDVSIYIDEIPIEDFVLATRFREECLSDAGEIICDKQTLHDNWLITKKLSKIWWLLTDDERNNTAGFIIRNWLFFSIPYHREGLPDCRGGTGDWKRTYCVGNAVIRLLRFGSGEGYYDDISHCYWSTDKVTEHCYWIESFDLPVFLANVHTHGTGFGHAVCAFQIRKDQKDFNSWRFFQYGNDNIKPGNWQMPCSYKGEEIHVHVVRALSLSCSGYGYDSIAKWKIDKDTCEPVPE